MTRLTRRYEFSAAHVLARSDWDSETNLKTYGKCANPNGHGHNYKLEVTVRGEVDPRTGRVIEPELLDRIVRRCVLDHVDRRFLNYEVPEFERTVPTAENIARFVWRSLHEALRPVILDRVRLVETENNVVEYSEGGMGS